jgi:hypothetical protein
MKLNQRFVAVPASQKQINFIEILSHNLKLSRASRNAHISSVVGFAWDNDIYQLSRSEASLVIEKFKEWTEK